MNRSATRAAVAPAKNCVFLQYFIITLFGVSLKRSGSDLLLSNRRKCFTNQLSMFFRLFVSARRMCRTRATQKPAHFVLSFFLSFFLPFFILKELAAAAPYRGVESRLSWKIHNDIIKTRRESSLSARREKS